MGARYDFRIPERFFQLGVACLTLAQEKFEKPVEVAYVFGRAEGDWEKTAKSPGLLETTVQYFRDGHFPLIAFSGLESEKPHNYPGGQAWKKHLLGLSVPEKNIELTRGLGWHTLGESEDVVLRACERSWHRMLILACPHQVLRIMLSLVKMMKVHAYEFTVRAAAPEPDWEEVVYGSQGKKKLSRKEHALEELARTQEYQQKGDIVSFQELHDYLVRTRRDTLEHS